MPHSEAPVFVKNSTTSARAHWVLPGHLLARPTELSSIDKGHAKGHCEKARRRREQMEFEEAALASLAISAAFGFGERFGDLPRW
jgi:hypothetical protein